MVRHGNSQAFVLRINNSRLFSHQLVPVTAAMVKELRDKIGAPMMECKKALGAPEVNGDIGKAIDYLRAKGIARANQQQSRAAHEGLIAIFNSEDRKLATLVEINSETDFVSRNLEFQSFVTSIAAAANASKVVGVVDIESLLKIVPSPSTSPLSIQDLLGEVVGKIRENIVIRRVLNVAASNETQTLATYVHGKVGDESFPKAIEMGRVASVVKVSVSPAMSALSEETHQALSGMLRKLSMHIVAAKPTHVNIADVPTDIIDKEKAIFREQSESTPAKKPEILEKMIMGKVNKRLAEICLLQQAHVAEEGSPVITKFLEDFSKREKCAVTVQTFELWNLGQN